LEGDQGQHPRLVTHKWGENGVQVGQRKARYDKVEANSTTTYYYVIELFNEKKGYVYNPNTRQCTVQALTVSPWCPPSPVPNADANPPPPPLSSLTFWLVVAAPLHPPQRG
jgi:hypothetical protein